jgi:hypothetical protein
VQGKVLDARTQAPVQGAKIFFTHRPSISTESDARGHFRLKATRNFHLAYVGPEAQDWPAHHYYDELTILSSNYMARSFAHWGLWDMRDPRATPSAGDPIVLRDILLEPKQ